MICGDTENIGGACTCFELTFFWPDHSQLAALIMFPDLAKYPLILVYFDRGEATFLQNLFRAGSI